MSATPAPKVTLNPRQQRFVAEYLIDQNATAAYKRAGYAAKGNAAEVSACQLLRLPKVARAIDAALTKTLGKLELTAERVLQELSRLTFADVGGFVDENGAAIPLHKLNEDLRRCIVGIEWKDGEPKYKLADKNTALGNALKVLGLLRERVEVTDKTPEKTDPMELARQAAFLFAKASHEAPRTVQ